MHEVAAAHPEERVELALALLVAHLQLALLKDLRHVAGRGVVAVARLHTDGALVRRTERPLQVLRLRLHTLRPAGHTPQHSLAARTRRALT